MEGGGRSASPDAPDRRARRLRKRCSRYVGGDGLERPVEHAKRFGPGRFSMILRNQCVCYTPMDTMNAGLYRHVQRRGGVSQRRIRGVPLQVSDFLSSQYDRCKYQTSSRASSIGLPLEPVRSTLACKYYTFACSATLACFTGRAALMARLRFRGGCCARSAEELAAAVVAAAVVARSAGELAAAGLLGRVASHHRPNAPLRFTCLPGL